MEILQPGQIPVPANGLPAASLETSFRVEVPAAAPTADHMDQAVLPPAATVPANLPQVEVHPAAALAAAAVAERRPL